MKKNNLESGQKLDATIDSITSSLRLLDDASDWNVVVRKVVVIVSASRSGSSLLYQALLKSKDVIAPAGENEPWLFLTKNKFPFIHSDAIEQINDLPLLLKLMRNDLLVREEKVDRRELLDLLWNRLTVRQEKDQLRKLAEIEASSESKMMTVKDAAVVLSILQKSALPSNTYTAQDYLSIENPPHIIQPHARRATIEELGLKTILFKSPSDAYRPGFYETLFPNAEITYVHLTRGFAQTVNGLMDGWMKNEIDFISNPIGEYAPKLQIGDYSLSDMTKRYWCFDLFPNWEKYTHASLVEVCAQQWLQAHASILEHFPNAPKIQFESFYTERDQFIKAVKQHTDISIESYDWDKKVMVTEEPKPFRWMKRESIFRHLSDHLDAATLKKVTALQQKLGYSMEETTWH